MKAFIKFICVIPFLLIQCCSTTAQISGRYVQTTQPSTDNQEIVLKPDGTFSYTLLFDVGGKFTFSGKWKQQGKIIKLIENPANSKVASKSSIVVSDDEDLPRLITVLNATDSTIVAGAQLSINDKEEIQFTDSKGTVTISNSEVNSLHLKIFETVDTVFIINKTGASNFIIYASIPEPKPWLTKIPTTEWIAKNGKLIATSEPKNVLTKVR